MPTDRGKFTMFKYAVKIRSKTIGGIKCNFTRARREIRIISVTKYTGHYEDARSLRRAQSSRNILSALGATTGRERL